MTEAEMKDWVNKNCKFAQVRPMPRKPFEDAGKPFAPVRKRFEDMAAPKPAQPPMATQRPVPTQAPMAPAAPQAPVSTQRPSNVPPVSPNLIDLQGKQRYQEYQNLMQEGPQQMDPDWVHMMPEKDQQLWQKYKSQGNQKGLSMLEEMHKRF